MYQLSHLLIEQRNILSTLREQNATEKTRDVLLDEPEKGELFQSWFSIGQKSIYLFTIFPDAINKDEIQNKRALAAIQESLIGFNGNLENKTFLHEGALIELDPDSYRPICRVYFFLLNDLLIVGKVKHDKYVELLRAKKNIQINIY